MCVSNTEGHSIFWASHYPGKGRDTGMRIAAKEGCWLVKFSGHVFLGLEPCVNHLNLCRLAQVLSCILVALRRTIKVAPSAIGGAAQSRGTAWRLRAVTAASMVTSPLATGIGSVAVRSRARPGLAYAWPNAGCHLGLLG